MKAVLYARFSPRPNRNAGKTGTAPGANSLSAEAQLAQCRGYCEFHNLEICGSYKDELKSGKEAETRVEFQKAIAHVCKLKGVLVVYSLSRFARSTLDAIAYVDKLNAAKAELASLKEQLDTTTPAGRLVFKVLASFAEFEREQSNERTADAMHYYQANGMRMGKIPPYGWQVDANNDKRLIENPHEQTIIKRIIELRRAGKKLRVISKILWREGLAGRQTPIYGEKTVVKWGKERKIKTDEIVAYRLGRFGHNVIKAILVRAGID